MLAYIWAEDSNRLIGNQGQLPWHLPADLKHFQKLTTGKTIIMGRRTYASFPNGPLPHRENWVLTTSAASEFPDTVQIFSSVAELQAALKVDSTREYLIIGGVSLFADFADEVTVLYQTKIAASYQGDVYFPNLDWSKFDLISQQDHPATLKNPAFSFQTFQRRESRLI